MTQLLEHAPANRRTESESAVAKVDVSICIVTWNSARWIESCLEAVREAAASISAEVIVVDNGSSDESLQLAQSAAFRRLRVVDASENHGFAGGVNRAISLSRGEYVLLLNPDCELAPDSLHQLKKFLDSSPKAAVAVPLLFGSDGEPQREFQLRRLPTVSSIASELLLFEKLVPTNRLTSQYRHRELDITAPARVEQPAAAAMMLRRSVIDSVGVFDERFAPAWFEDVDYCQRLHDAGAEIWLVPKARATHRGGASLEHISFNQFTEIWYRNLYRYAKKWFKPRQVETLRWLIIAGMCMRIAALSVGLQRKPVGRRVAFRAYRQVIRQAFERWGETSPSS
jgi:GT2 family glycosyltransferase